MKNMISRCLVLCPFVLVLFLGNEASNVVVHLCLFNVSKCLFGRFARMRSFFHLASNLDERTTMSKLNFSLTDCRKQRQLLGKYFQDKGFFITCNNCTRFEMWKNMFNWNKEVVIDVHTCRILTDFKLKKNQWTWLVYAMTRRNQSMKWSRERKRFRCTVGSSSMTKDYSIPIHYSR